LANQNDLQLDYQLPKALSDEEMTEGNEEAMETERKDKKLALS
jgi:hypothetical protein